MARHNYTSGRGKHGRPMFKGEVSIEIKGCTIRQLACVEAGRLVVSHVVDTVYITDPPPELSTNCQMPIQSSPCIFTPFPALHNTSHARHIHSIITGGSKSGPPKKTLQKETPRKWRSPLLTANRRGPDLNRRLRRE